MKSPALRRLVAHGSMFTLAHVLALRSRRPASLEENGLAESLAGDLGAVLAAAARRASAAGASVRALSAQILGPGTGELPRAEIVPPERWAEHPGAMRYRGVLDTNVIWVLPEPGGLRIEAYDHHPDAPDRLWRWTSLQRNVAVERRFIRGQP